MHEDFLCICMAGPKTRSMKKARRWGRNFTSSVAYQDYFVLAVALGTEAQNDQRNGELTIIADGV